MALHPQPFDVVPRRLDDQPLPQVSVRDRLFRGGFPAVALPAVDPFGDAVADIDAVGRTFDAAAPPERGERLDRAHQFHAVVHSLVLAPTQLLTHIPPAPPPERKS